MVCERVIVLNLRAEPEGMNITECRKEIETPDPVVKDLELALK